MKLITFSILILFELALVACSEQKNAEKFAGFTAVSTDKGRAIFYIDTNTVKRSNSDYISFNLVRVLPNGYAIQDAETDCKSTFNAFEGVKFRDDGTSEEKFIAETLALPNKESPDINALVTMACDKAEENRIKLGDFDDIKALEKLYGTYQPVTQTALWERIEPPTTLHGYEQFFGKTGTVKILDSKDFIQQGTTKHAVLTSTSVNDSSQVLLSAAVFTGSDAKWQLEAEYRYLKVATDGVPKKFYWQKIGKDRYGIVEEAKNEIYIYEQDDNNLKIAIHYKPPKKSGYADSDKVKPLEQFNYDRYGIINVDHLDVSFFDSSEQDYYSALVVAYYVDGAKVEQAYQFQDGEYFPLGAITLKNLFDMKTPSDEVKTGKEVSNVLFETSFQDDNDRLYVTFIKTTPDNFSDNKISAVTYKQVNGKWQVVLKQLNFAELFNSLVGPNFDASKIETLQLNPHSIGLLVESLDGGSAFITRFKMILEYSKSWRYLGEIESDSICFCQTSGTPYGYNGRISIIKSKKEIPDLLVTKTGTEADLKGNIFPAKNAIYVFNGKEYEEKP